MKERKLINTMMRVMVMVLVLVARERRRKKRKGKEVILKFNFFLLPNKTEWALVYCPEALCLHSAGSYTDCTNELDL